MTGMVFYAKGNCKISEGKTLTTDTPCMVLYTSTGGKEVLNISDPTHLQSVIHLAINSKTTFKESGQVSYDRVKNITTVTIQLPKGGAAGKTVTIQ